MYKYHYLTFLLLLFGWHCTAQSTDSLNQKYYQHVPPIVKPRPNIIVGGTVDQFITETMPYLKTDSCEAKSWEERKACSDHALREYMRKKQRYSEADRLAGNEGKVFMRFVVTVEGKMEKIEVAKNASNSKEFEKDAIRVLNQLNAEMTWEPGKQSNVAVPVRITVPFVYKLD